MKKLIVLIFLLVLAIPASASEFNCKFPPYGKNLDHLHEKGLFVEHSKKNGITYYKYTEPCVLDINKYIPVVEQYFGFINGKLYCNISSFKLPEDVSHTEFEDYCYSLIKDYVVGKVKEQKDGDWIVKRYKDRKEGLIVKLKYNPKTRQYKAAWYYKPVKEELNLSDDDK